MELVKKLHEEAASLRALARRADMFPLRDQLLDLAARCEELAKSMEENPEEAGLTPPDAPPDLH